MFTFSDPAPPDRFLLDRSFQKKPDSPFGNDQACVLIGVVRMSAALADELGLGGPVVRMNVPAPGALLRTVVRRNLENQFPVSF